MQDGVFGRDNAERRWVRMGYLNHIGEALRPYRVWEVIQVRRAEHVLSGVVKTEELECAREVGLYKFGRGRAHGFYL